MDLQKNSTKPKKANMELKHLSKTIAEHLINAMDTMNKDGLSPGKVNAMCNCAAQLHKIMRLNIELYRIGLRE